MVKTASTLRRMTLFLTPVFVFTSAALTTQVVAHLLIFSSAFHDCEGLIGGAIGCRSPLDCEFVTFQHCFTKTASAVDLSRELSVAAADS
jgi:hypothetical protein